MFRFRITDVLDELTVEVVFMISDKEAAQFLKVIEQEKVRVFYVKTTAEYGMINGE